MGDVLAVRDAYRTREWAMLIQACGLTKRKFCQQRGISEKSFYYWLMEGLRIEQKTAIRKGKPVALW